MSELWPLIEKYKEARSYDWDVSEKLSAIKAIDSFIEAKERELSEAKKREAWLRAHIQEAADIHKNDESIGCDVNLHYWHLAALEQNNE